MTNKKNTKRRRLSHEILGMIGLSALLALLLFLILSGVALVVAETYCFEHDIPMTEFDWIEVDRWIFGLSALLAGCAFTILFLSLLHDRIAYIRTITRGIDELGAGQTDAQLPLDGNNELTDLARAINDMSAARKQLRQKEQALAAEKDQLIHDLSHDIRTPLTSILAYSEYLSAQEQVSPQEQQKYLQMINQKAGQIRELTAVLLDGTQRKPEWFEHGEVLMAQIAAEFESELEDRFQVQTDLSGCAAFGGKFDLQELRRIFDNLGSNVSKYADPAHPVRLSIGTEENRLVIRQSNAVLGSAPRAESYRIGLNSIRRIAQNYAGQVAVRQDAGQFEIIITFVDIL